MKKYIALLLALLLCFALCACGEGTDTQPSSQPTQGSQVTKPTQGKPDDKPTTPPTEPTQPSTAPHEHSYTSVVTPPTCTEKGYTTFTCACGDSYTADKTDVVEHDYQETAREAATTTKEGSITYTCPNCGASHTEVIPVLAMPSSSLEVLDAVWNTWDWEYKQDYFFGGSYSNPVSGAPGAVDISETDAMPWPIIIPATKFDEVKTTALISHMFGCRAFVSSVMQVEDTVAFTSAMIIDMLKAVQYDSGAPEYLMVYLFNDEYVIVTVGSADIMQSYRSALKEACTRVLRVYDGPMKGNAQADQMYQGDPSCEHSYTSVVNAPTVYVDGSAIYTCNICGDAYAKILSAGSAGLEYQANDDGTYTVVGLGTCTDSHVVIPKYYEGAMVTGIGRRAFYNCSTITEITIPETISEIGQQIFYKCDALHTVYYNSTYSNSDNPFLNVASIKKVVFGGKRVPNNICQGLKNLEEVVILNSVTSIRESAFVGCSSLTSIVIPDSVTSIGDNAFTVCSSLTSIVIPDSVTSIGDHVFHDCSSLTSIVIPDSISSIAWYTFCGCSSLTSIEIPDNITSIGNFAFSNCRSLVSIKIPNSVTSISNYAFSGCSSLESIDIPDSVISIGERAFSGCSSLTSIDIPDSVISIGERAFSGSSLTSIVIPDSLTSIGKWAFAGCSSLTSIVIPDSVTSISYDAFYECSSLVSIVIPDSVTRIGDDAFNGCSNLKAIHFGGTKEQWNAIYKGYEWNYNTGNYTIYCTDGEISK